MEDIQVPQCEHQVLFWMRKKLWDIWAGLEARSRSRGGTLLWNGSWVPGKMLTFLLFWYLKWQSVLMCGHWITPIAPVLFSQALLLWFVVFFVLFLFKLAASVSTCSSYQNKHTKKPNPKQLHDATVVLFIPLCVLVLNCLITGHTLWVFILPLLGCLCRAS